MTHYARLLAVAVAASLFTAFAPSPGAYAGTCWDYTKKETTLKTKINTSRANHGVGKLTIDPQLSKVARSHARTMARKDSVYHTKNLGEKVTNWSMLGENVGNHSKGVKAIHKAFMNSPLHKANILDSSWDYMGVGVIKKDGWIFVTEIFEATNNPGTTLTMPSC